MPRPSPRLPPVTTTLRMTSQLAAGGNVEGRNETDGGRNLVSREALAAYLEDLALDVAAVPVRARLRGIDREHDVGCDERAGDRASAGSYLRHAHGRVPVDGRLDFLR